MNTPLIPDSPHRHSRNAIAALLALPLLCASGRTAQPTGRVRTLAIHSKVYGDKRAVYIYTPPGYPKGGPFPVIYTTDGWQYWKHIDLPETMERLTAEKKMPPAMAVMMDPGNYSGSRFAEYLADPRLVKYLRTEIIPMVDKQYRTVRSPKGRTVLGSSLGGLSAVYVAWTAPDLFAKAISQSGSFHWPGQNVVGLVENAKPPSVKVALTAGRHEGPYRSAQEMDTLLTQKKVTHKLFLTDGTHSNGSWKESLPLGLEWLFRSSGA